MRDTHKAHTMDEPTTKPSEARAPRASHWGSEARLKALVVDGDEANRSFAAETLHSFAPGFDVATARDPEQACAWLETFRPDLVVIESGFLEDGAGSLMERLRTDPRTRGCRMVVVASGERAGKTPDDGRLERARLEADAVIEAPFGLPRLLDVVRRVMKHEESH